MEYVVMIVSHLQSGHFVKAFDILIAQDFVAILMNSLFLPQSFNWPMRLCVPNPPLRCSRSHPG